MIQKKIIGGRLKTLLLICSKLIIDLLWSIKLIQNDILIDFNSSFYDKFELLVVLITHR